MDSLKSPCDSSISSEESLQENQVFDSEDENNNISEGESNDNGEEEDGFPVDEFQSVKYVIPRVHIKKCINEILKMLFESNGNKIKISTKARKLIHLHCESYLMDIFELCEKVQTLNDSKTLNKKTFKLCSNLLSKNLLHGKTTT